MKGTRASRPAPLPEGVEIDMVRSLDRAPVVHGLDALVDRIAGLIRRGAQHPVLVGPSEVGKTAVVWALARAIANGARPGGATAIWQVSLRSLEALPGKDDSVGSRLAAVLHEAATSSARPIVFVRDLRMLRAFDAQHALVESLAREDVLFLGEAGSLFAAWCGDDPELAAATYLVRMEEPSREATLEWLRAQARHVAMTREIAISEAALQRVVRHADRLMPQRRFPGKAFALLHECVREASARSDPQLTPSLVSERVAESLRVPRFLIDPDVPFDLGALAQHLRARVVGQDEAIDAVVQSLARYKADLADESRPIGVLLFAGPPGVGKTLLAQSVAEYVFGSESRLVRLPLAEHSEDWKVDQIFGQRSSQSVDGRRGVLARQLMGKPFAVLLLDEIEKAHPLAFKHLLRPLDEGTYVNGNDEEISLRNTLVIATTGVGADEYREPVLGFGRTVTARGESVRKRIADEFPGDLLDRIDRVCVCPPLGGDELRRVARRELDAALARNGIAGRRISVDVDDAVLDLVIADQGAVHAGGATGARAVRRSLDRVVLAPLARFLLERELPAGALVRVAAMDGAAVPSHHTVVATARVASRERRAEIRVRTVRSEPAENKTPSVESPAEVERPAARQSRRPPSV